MKKTIVVLLALVVLVPLSWGQGRELTVYFNDRPPLYIVNGQTGFLVDIVELILDEAKIPYKFVEMPSNRIQELLKTGAEHATGIGWFKNPDRETWAQFSKPIYQDKPQVALVAKTKAASLGSSVSLDGLLKSGLTLGKKDGYSFGTALDERIAASGVKISPSTVEIPQLVKLVGLGRLDFTILGIEEATYIIKSDSTIKDVVIVPISDPPAGNFRYFMLSKSVDKATLDRLNAAIDKVLASPAYKKLTTF